jgi:opacity protein-like surface antigen
MKKILVLSVIWMTAAVSGYAQRGHFSTGASLGYALEHESVAFGVDARYSVLSDLRVAPSLTYVFKNKGVQTFYIDADAHYLFDVTDRIVFYPIGGVSFSMWNNDRKLYVAPERDGSWWSLNIGIGTEIRVFDNFSVGVDFKYNTIKEALFLTHAAYHFQF